MGQKMVRGGLGCFRHGATWIAKGGKSSREGGRLSPERAGATVT